MRGIVVGLALICGTLGGAAVAQPTELDKCEQTEAWFNLAIDSRLAGQNKAQVRAALRAEMQRKAADELADFVFSVPRAQLTPAIARAVRTQCEQM